MQQKAVAIKLRAGGFEKPGWSADEMEKEPRKVIWN